MTVQSAFNQDGVILSPEDQLDFGGLDPSTVTKIVAIIAEVSAILGHGPNYQDVDKGSQSMIWTPDIKRAATQTTPSDYVQLVWTKTGEITFDWDLPDCNERYALVGLHSELRITD